MGYFMDFETLSVGQKKKTCRALCLASSSFHIYEGKRIMYSVKTLPLCIYSACCLIFFLFPTAVSFILYRMADQHAFSLLNTQSARLLLTSFCTILTFFCLFLSHVFYTKALIYALFLQDSQAENMSALYTGKTDFRKLLLSYIITVISYIPPFLLCALSLSVFAEAEEFSTVIGIICTIMILTSLYLLCIINCVMSIYRCTDSLQYALRSIRGHVCEYIFLNVRLIPCRLLSLLSLGVLIPFYSMPYTMLCYSSYISFLRSSQNYAYSYDSESQKGRISNGE